MTIVSFVVEAVTIDIRITYITFTIAVHVLLGRIRLPRTVVVHIENPITVNIITRITLAVFIQVCLIRVGNQRTIVVNVKGAVVVIIRV